MKKQTRILSLLLVVVMIVSTLAGCAGKPNVDALPEADVGTGIKSNNEVIVDENGNRYIDLNDYPELAEQLAAEEKKSDHREWNQAGEQIKDEEGNFIVPFDRAYPKVFENGDVEYDKEHALLKLNAEVSEVSRELRACGFAGVEKFLSTEKGDWCRATVAPTSDVVTAVNNARELDCVLMADFDYITRTEAVEVEATENGLMDHVLDNEQVTEQWYLTQSEIQRAWRFLELNGSQAGGDSSVVVAVIDTGVDYNHPDLKANMWINMGEIPGNGIDDDGNGYVDDVYGCSTIGNTFDASGDPMDDHGHGTHVAGIIGASNNREGIVGIAYNTKIMAIKAGQASGVFNQSDIAEAILYAYENGADVINMSFGGSACSIAVQDALSTAYTRSTLVASAGNDGLPNQPIPPKYPVALPNYPAALSYVIGVMSVNPQGVESGFTNFDRTAFNTIEYEVYAPGESILSTLPGGRYGKLSGTSMSAPVVSASAALLRSYFKDRDMYPSKFIAAQLSATSEDTAICNHEVVHNVPMILNTYDALTKLPKPDISLYNYYLFDSESIAEGNNGDGVIDAGETVNIGAVLRNRWGMSKDTIITIDALGDLGIANPYVEIINGTSNFEGVGTYSTKDQLIRDEDKIVVGTEEPLTFKISKNCPNDYLVVLNVTITYKNGLDEDDLTSYVNDKGLIEFRVRNGVVLPSVIREDMTLTKDNYYIIPNSTYIPTGVTVAVEPGTQIQFWSDDPSDPYADTYMAYLNVDGQFICKGNDKEPIELFPSNAMFFYTVEIRGNADLQYTNIANPLLDVNSIDHCNFYQSNENMIYHRELSLGVVANNSSFSLTVKSNHTIMNSSFINLGYEGYQDLYSYGFSVGIGCKLAVYADCDTCAFVNCDAVYNEALFAPKRRYYMSNCIFVGNNIKTENGTYVSSYSTSDGYNFVGNAILNNLNDTDVSHWLRILSAKNYTPYDMIHISGNYWGTTDERMIEKQIVDFDDYQSLADIVVGEYLTVAPENTFPFVVDAYLLDRDGNRQFAVTNDTYTFVVEFNRDMDTTVPLRVRFGSSEPYAEYEISGEYVNARRWEGTYTLKTTIENGNQFFNIENGRAADDHFMALYDTPGRFMFEIDTTAAQALIMQGNATETGIELTWEQDDFDTLAGYNVYRSDREDGYYTRLNSVVIPADTKTFFDDTVEPGKVYYYNFTVVQSDMQESEPSGKIVIMSMDTMAPNIYHSPVRTAYTGNNLVVGATITDNLMIASATLYYRVVGTTEWKSTTMTANNSRYTAIIPADALSLDGMEYYIDAFDGVSHTYKGNADNTFAVVVKLAVDRNSIGDVDGNGIIEMLDALMLLQAANDRLNLTEEQFLRADINGDGELSAAEALRILQYVSGKVTTIQF